MVCNLDKTRFSERIRVCAAELRREGVPALGRLYDLTAPRLLRYAITLTRSRDDAEDAVQAAMLRVVLKPRALAEARFPWPYFLRVVRNEALSITRRRPRMQLVSTFIDAWGEVEVQWLADELKHSVRTALRKLPPSQAEVVVLKIWEQMTFAEIADVLDESPNTVASRYRYALQKLTRYLEPYRDEVFHA